MMKMICYLFVFDDKIYIKESKTIEFKDSFRVYPSYESTKKPTNILVNATLTIKEFEQIRCNDIVASYKNRVL